MEKYSSITNFDHSLLVRVLAIFGMITALILGSWCVVGSSSTFAVSSSPVPSTNLPSVKIASPHKGQQVPVGSTVVVSGISSPPPADKNRTDCTVSVLLNAVKPYQKAVAAGHGGITDYSTWRYGITSNYAAIKQGQNKITAKISCAAPTNLTKFDSLNVTGIGTPHSVNGQNGKNGTNGTNGISSGGNGGSANGGNGGSANGGNGGSANAGRGGSGGNGGNGGSAIAGNEGSAVGGNGGTGGNGGNGGNADGRNG